MLASTYTTKELGAVIRAERKRQGLNQSDLAGLCNVGVTFLSQLENGKRTSEVGKVLDVLHTLGIDVHLVRRGEQAGDAS